MRLADTNDMQSYQRATSIKIAVTEARRSAEEGHKGGLANHLAKKFGGMRQSEQVGSTMQGEGVCVCVVAVASVWFPGA